MVTIPSFSIPTTRAAFDDLISKLAQDFSNQGYTSNAKTLAAMAINLKQQGLSDTEIKKQVESQIAHDQAQIKQIEEKSAAALAAQQPVLDELAKQKAILDAKAKTLQSQAKVLTADELRAQNNAAKPEPMVANPLDTRGPLITQSQYDAIIAKQAEQGKYTVNYTGNPNTDNIRAQIEAEKAGTATPYVIDINESYVLLSNGQLVDRATYKGTIPADLLAKEAGVKTPQFPTSQTFEETLAKAAPTAKDSALSGIKPQTSTTEAATSAVKSSATSARYSNNVFNQNPPAPENTLGGALDQLGKQISDILNGGKTEQPKNTDTTPEKTQADPLKAVTDAVSSTVNAITTGLAGLLSGGAKTQTETTQQPTTPKPTGSSTSTAKTPEPPISGQDEGHTDGQPEPPTPITTSQKAVKFLKDNAVVIVAGVAAVSMLGAFLASQKYVNPEIMKRDR